MSKFIPQHSAAQKKRMDDLQNAVGTKVFIATPAYGSMVTTNYCLSLLHSNEVFAAKKVTPAIYMIGNESLISRARNRCATIALEQGFDKLLFIDADVAWTPEDLGLILDSKRDIVGGAYPVKTYPISMNFNAMPQHKMMFPNGNKPMSQFRDFAKLAEPNGEIEVEHIATGFMMIDCKVLKSLAQSVPTYQNFEISEMKEHRYYDFFPVGTYGGLYESEDWAFCRMARESGFSVWLNTKVLLTHTGTWTFDARHE